VPGTGVTLAGLPISFDGERPQIRTLGPQLGQDNDAYLRKDATGSRGKCDE
jgi:hypothetical protein